MTNDKKIELLKPFTFIRPIDERILKAIDVCVEYEITALQSSLKEKEKETVELQQSTSYAEIVRLNKELAEKEKECEELKVCFENSCNDGRSSYKLIEELKAENEHLRKQLQVFTHGSDFQE